ncbi:MAG: acyl-CoA dehydrogenase C-terminal domain-containing protein [Gemmatimonadaceae bacterium]
MPTFHAPTQDYRFLLTEVFDLQRLSTYPGYEEATSDLLVSVLEEAGALCEELLFPLNMAGDAEGCTWDNGTVRTPTGFREAFRQYAAGGWIGLSSDPAYGGQGLPIVMRYVIDEMVCAANLSFAMYPGLTQGALEAIHTHGTEDLHAKFLPKMTTGEWTGTMCLTEAHAGTDLGMIRTRAQPMDDGSCSISGTKIFITAGEHDLAKNIIHLVLAKLPDAPAGSRGISMFLVPKFLVNADGSLGPRNGVTCGSIEHKMGIKGSATCVINFDNAKGWLVGEAHKGLRAMFTMMNGARLGVGLQGLGLAHASYQSAVAYARERLQGRALSGPKNAGGPADPIIEHADIRRGLLAMRAFIEGARALAVFCALQLDDEHMHPDASVREQAADLVALLTPIIKALFTDLGFESTNIGMQTLGGHGYIREYGMEQYVRDARIGQIYEGTNHVQALDLVGRKLGEGNGRLLTRYLGIVGGELAAARSVHGLEEHTATLAEAVQRLERSTLQIAQRALKSPDEVGAAASEYLRMFGFVALGHMWLRMARIAGERARSGGALSADFYQARLGVARYYFQRVMPQTVALAAAIEAGASPVVDFPTSWF